MVAAVRGEKFVEVTEDLQRDDDYYSAFNIGEMMPVDPDGNCPHYAALDEVQEWLGFTNYEDYAKALETEREKIFERAEEGGSRNGEV